MCSAEAEMSSPPRLDGARVAEREAAAERPHHWVRLTRCCNNRCIFCSDAGAHTGQHVPVEVARQQIIDGRRAGAERLILSGGEATIHPRFVDFVRFGRTVGYPEIQVITNGRMFSYPGFLQRSLAAGLTEITFSIHGHCAELHDRLVGVPGAFDEASRGLSAALADGRAVVNVDICLNAANIGQLPAILDWFVSQGVREFDLLHLIPFGRAFADSGSSLAYDVEAAMPAIAYALELARRPGLFVWFNRFPPPFLEGHEHLIQDPHKLLDEVTGRREELEQWVTCGTALACRDVERCSRCYLGGLCATLERARGMLARGDFDFLRLRRSHSALPPVGGRRGVWICAETAGAALARVAALPGEEVILELDSYDGLVAAMQGGRFGGKRLVRVYVTRPADLEMLLADGGDFEVVAFLLRDMAECLACVPSGATSRLAVAGKNHARLSDALRLDADLAAFFSSVDFRGPVENVPACLCRRQPRVSPTVIDGECLGPGGGIDLLGFTRCYVTGDYYSHSRRCAGCRLRAGCRGAHINFVRAHGYGLLEPVT
jgi:pyruvate-formate lyase-activating enzyme